MNTIPFQKPLWNVIFADTLFFPFSSMCAKLSFHRIDVESWNLCFVQKIFSLFRWDFILRLLCSQVGAFGTSLFQFSLSVAFLSLAVFVLLHNSFSHSCQLRFFIACGCDPFERMTYSQLILQEISSREKENKLFEQQSKCFRDFLDVFGAWLLNNGRCYSSVLQEGIISRGCCR